MLWFKIDVFKAKQIIERPAADQAQVTRKNSVIIGRLCICVGKVINECLCCGRRHSCSHIISVGYAEVNYFSGRCPSYASALFSVAYNATSRTCNSPLCGRCANSAVFEDFETDRSVSTHPYGIISYANHSDLIEGNPSVQICYTNENKFMNVCDNVEAFIRLWVSAGLTW